MINLKSIDYKLLKDKLQVKKPWDHVIIFTLNFLIAIPIFIITLQHLSFDEYVQGPTVAQRREWAKIHAFSP